jgi:pyrroloquinoline quinone biosynthesis protein B
VSVNDGDRTYLLDATPDVRFQIATVPDGVFLSHAHLGHLSGLLHFGKEAVDTNDLPVYCTPGMGDVIRENAPFSLLVDWNTVDLHHVEDGNRVELGKGWIELRRVAHREALPTGTLSFFIAGTDRNLYYVSDIDEWTDAALASVREADVALVDGTFYSRDELDRIESVPHPTMRDTMDRLADTTTDVYFTHLNHSNPALRPDTDARQELQNRGFGVVERGDTFEL